MDDYSPGQAIPFIQLELLWVDTVPPPQWLSYHIDLIRVKEPDRFLRIIKEPHTSTVILYIAAKIVHVAQSGHYHRHCISGLHGLGSHCGNRVTEVFEGCFGHRSQHLQH